MQLQRIAQHVDKNHEHIIAHDSSYFSFLTTNYVKSPTFRKSICKDFEKAKARFAKGIDDCIDSWCNKEEYPRPLYWSGKHPSPKKLARRLSN